MSDEPRSAQRYLEDLTPGGSEYFNNPKRCYEWAQGRIEASHRIAMEAALERNRLREEVEQINRLANRALENLHGGWHALTEHQLTLIIEATGGFDKIALEARRPKVTDHKFRPARLSGEDMCTYSWRVESERTYCQHPNADHQPAPTTGRSE